MSLASSRASVERRPSSLRLRLPESTWSLARPLMPHFGITRVTDITRMDWLGLPVFASIRPRSLTLRVNAGKGLNAIDAQVGALMEAIEYAAAEPAVADLAGARMPLGAMLESMPGSPSPLEFAPQLAALRDLRGALGTLPAPDPATLARHLAATMDLDRPRLCTTAESLADGRPCHVPAELVFTPCPFDEDGPVFGWSTNGLASGNSVDEATLHALFEVLERDAVAIDAIRGGSRWVDPDSLPEPFPTWARHWARRGVTLTVRAVPPTAGLPCFSAALHEAASASVDLAMGFGLHADPRIALTRAVCEAAQARLSHIHGGRDDITRFHDAMNAGDADERARRHATAVDRATARTRPMRYDEVDAPDLGLVSAGDAGSIAGLLARLQDRMARHGFGPVLRHRFALPTEALAVVKVIVPGAEDLDHPVQRMGARMLACAIAPTPEATPDV